MRQITLSLLALALFIGCPDPDTEEPAEKWIALELALAEEATFAGTPVGYTATLIGECGTRKETAVELTSDVEPGVVYTETDVTATFVGDHQITATKAVSDNDLSATATLTVWVDDLAEIDLVLDDSVAVAGDWVDYTVVGYDAFGNEVDLEGVEMTSDEEIEISGTKVRGGVVGSWTITASLSPFADSETLDIIAGEVDEVELILSSNAMAAGDTVTWSALFWDNWGNEITDPVATEVTCTSPDVVITGTDITTTVAADYTIRIDVLEGSNPWDGAFLVVGAAAPATIDLSIAPFPCEVQDPVLGTAVLLDQYGNVSDDTWTLSATAEIGSDINTVTVNGHYLEFFADGEFSAIATADSSGVQDTVGPFLVDSFGPIINLTNPERGAWRTAYPDNVTGTITDPWSPPVVTATVNGTPLSLDQNGAFSHPITYDFGTNLVESLATDSDGNESSDRRAVLAGDFVPEGGGVPDGLIARINEAGLDSIETLGEDLITGIDLGTLLTNPVYSDSADVWGLEYYALELNVYNPTFSGASLDLDPKAAGHIETSITLYDLYVDYGASAYIIPISYNGTGYISADSITVSMDLTATVNNGLIGISIANVAISSQNFDFHLDSWIYDVATFLGINIDGIVYDFLVDAIVGMVQTEIPALLEDTLQGLELAVDLPLQLLNSNNTYHLVAAPYGIDVDEQGLALSLQTHFTPDAWNANYTGLGSLYTDYTVPVFDTAPGMVLSISANFLNQALFAFWGGGLLTQQLRLADLGIDAADLPIPGLTDPWIEIDAMLPPVVLPGTDSHMTDLQLGDMELALYSDDPADPNNLMMVFYIGLDAGLELTVTQNQTLAASITDVNAWFDLIYPEMPASQSITMEDLLDQLIPVLTPLLTGAIGEIPIPEIQGFTLDNLSIDVGGAESGFINASGDLVGP